MNREECKNLAEELAGLLLATVERVEHTLGVCCVYDSAAMADRLWETIEKLNAAKPCICGGTGQAQDEAHGLRIELLELLKLQAIEKKQATVLRAVGEWYKHPLPFSRMAYTRLLSVLNACEALEREKKEAEYEIGSL